MIGEKILSRGEKAGLVSAQPHTLLLNERDLAGLAATEPFLIAGGGYTHYIRHFFFPGQKAAKRSPC
jgi:hypothetical protein